MIDAGKRLERGGADFIIIASNTMNSTADDIEKEVKIPVFDSMQIHCEAAMDYALGNK